MKSPKEIGEILKNAHQKKGISQDKIYSGTRIQSNIIEALENGKADEILGRIYVILFLKKYASFLNLDAESLANEYKASYRIEEKQPLDIKKDPLATEIDTQKWIALLLHIIGALLLIFFILLLGIRVKSFFIARKDRIKEARVSRQASKLIPKKISKTPSDTIFPIPKDKPIKLVLFGAEDVWMKVKKDGKTIFQGTLSKNTEKTWSANDNLELWVGRAEALDFTINDKSLGKIGKGSIKSIQISKEGLKIGKKWLYQAEK